MNVDTERVISEVSSRRCLWDSTLDTYKNQYNKKNAWLQVVKEVIPDYDNLSDGKKRKLVVKIQHRWKNARDCYIKTRMAKRGIKQGSGEKPPKSYIFYEQLRFLDKLKESDVPESDSKIIPVSFEPTSDDCEDIEPGPKNISLNKRKRHSDSSVDNKITNMVTRTPNDENDSDVSFFNSLLPMVRELNTFDKLTFRSTIINELLNFQRRDNNLPKNPSTTTPTTTATIKIDCNDPLNF